MNENGKEKIETNVIKITKKKKKILKTGRKKEKSEDVTFLDYERIKSRKEKKRKISKRK